VVRDENDDVKVKDRVPSKELRERLGLDDIFRYYSKKVTMVLACVTKRRQ